MSSIIKSDELGLKGVTVKPLNYKEIEAVKSAICAMSEQEKRIAVICNK